MRAIADSQPAKDGWKFDAGETPRNGTGTLTYNWCFPHHLWLAVAINEEGGIASAIHQRDDILAGAFPDADGASHELREVDPSAADIPKEQMSSADLWSRVPTVRRFWLRFASTVRSTGDR